MIHDRGPLSRISFDQRVGILLLVLAGILRLWALDLKPPHFDEGVNGYFVDRMTKEGGYAYDPQNYHGPLHFYFLFLAQTLFGRDIFVLRLSTVLFGIATVGLILRFDRFFDRRICRWAAAAMAVSPAFIYFSRHAIHEAELAFFLVLLLYGVAGIWKFGEKRYLWATGVAVGGLVLTKETYIIHLTCFALAIVALRVLERFSPSEGWRERAAPRWRARDVLVMAMVVIAGIVFFYSKGGTQLSLLKGLYQTFFAWAETAHQQHVTENSWFFWVKLAARYEWPVLLGMVAAGMAVIPRTDRLVRFISIYGLGTLVAYSLIPYKTPWCILAVAWPFCFTFGALLHAAFGNRWRTVAIPIGGVVLGVSTVSAVSLNFFRYTVEAEPYVYVQTFEEIDQLTLPLKWLTDQDPAAFHRSGYIMIESYYPLPWTLGDFTAVAYYGLSLKPPHYKAAFLVVDPSRVEEVEAGLARAYYKSSFHLRAGQQASWLYLDAELFADYFTERDPEFIPASIP